MDLKKEIERVYKEAVQKIMELKNKRKLIVNGYIKDLEQEKINSIRKSLDLK